MVLAKPGTREEGQDLLPGPLYRSFQRFSQSTLQQEKAEMLTS
jgi:hypothetical protein